MSELPHGLTEALHYLEPFPWMRVVGVALALAALGLVWRRWRRKSEPAPVPQTAPPSAPPTAAGILVQLKRLRRRHLGARSYRQGCHELSSLLRRHLEATRSRPFSRWTAREARRAEGDTVWTRLLGLVSQLQFSRRPPRRSDFEGLCDLTRDALRPEERG